MMKGLPFAVIFFVSASFITARDSSVAVAKDETYRIPAENSLRKTFAADFVRLAYGASESPEEIGLVFTGKEVAAAIPGFHAQVPGYLGPVDSSPSVVVSASLPSSNFDELLAQGTARIDKSLPSVSYRETTWFWPDDSSAMWHLTEEGGAWSRSDMFPPSCRASRNRNGSARHSCLFTLRRGTHEFFFSLAGENVEFADEFVTFVENKLDGWRVKSSK